MKITVFYITPVDDADYARLSNVYRGFLFIMKKNDAKIGMKVWFKKHAFPVKVNGEYQQLANKSFIVAGIELSGLKLEGIKKVINTGELSMEQCVKDCKYKSF